MPRKKTWRKSVAKRCKNEGDEPRKKVSFEGDEPRKKVSFEGDEPRKKVSFEGDEPRKKVSFKGREEDNLDKKCQHRNLLENKCLSEFNSDMQQTNVICPRDCPLFEKISSPCFTNITFGTYNLESFEFSNLSRGKQSICTSLMSLMYLQSKDTFESGDLDLILNEGDHLHQEEVAKHSQVDGNSSGTFTVDEIPNTVLLSGKKFILKKRHYFTGTIEKVSNDNFCSLRTALLNTFSEVSDAILIFGPYSFAVSKASEQYAFFNSHGSDSDGFSDFFGPSVLIQLSTLENLVCFVEKFVSSLGFTGKSLFLVQPLDIQPAATPQNKTTEASPDHLDRLDLFHHVQTLHYKENTQTVFGSFNQGSSDFPPESRGRQCTCNALASLCSLHVKLIHTQNDIDCILVEGDNLYRETLALLSSTDQLQSEYLRLDELPERLEIFDTNFCVTKLAFLTGQINMTSSGLFVSLETALTRSFEQSNSALLMIGSYAMSVFKDDGKYVFFDSHSHGFNGLSHHSGTSIMMTFNCFEDLVTYLLKYSSSLGFQNETLFDLQPVQINVQYAESSLLGTDTVDSLMNNYFAYQMQQKKRKDHKSYMREYQRLRRQNTDLMQKQRESNLKSKRNARCDPLFKEKEQKSKQAVRLDPQYKEKERKSKEGVRSNPQYKEKENKLKQALRSDPQYKEKELKSKQAVRLDPQYKEKERKSKEGVRSNPQYKEKENKLKQALRSDPQYKEKELKSKQAVRLDPQYKEKENKLKQALRSDPQYKEKELKSKQAVRLDPQCQVKERKSKASSRSNPVNRDLERQKECAFKKRKRENPFVKEQERVAKRQKRLDSSHQRNERVRNSTRKADKRRQPEYVAHEKDLAKRRRLTESIETCIERFHDSIALGPSFVCTCCHQMMFRQSVEEADVQKVDVHMMDHFNGLKSVGDKEWLCHTCMKYLKDGKTPPLSVANGMNFPEKPDALNLHQLEERLIALRIPFMQVRELPRGGQSSIRGNVVNVPADVSNSVNALPLTLNESETIPIKLKRKLSYNSSAFVENVRPNKVMKGLKWLMEHSPLYKQSNITIDKNWTDNLLESTEQDVSEFLEIPSQTSLLSPKLHRPHSDDENEDSDHFSEIDENETAFGNSDTMLDNNSHLDIVYSVAPGEGQHPLSVFQDKDAESLAFPTIYCGQKQIENSERKVPIHYSDQVKWELRAKDRRVAKCVPNLFFKVKKSQMKQVKDKATLALRRVKIKSKKLTAKQMLDSDQVKHIVNLDEGFYIFRSLRNSPPYLEKRKKDVFAMIRQLGLPTWFTSFSAADTKWVDLLKILGRFVDKLEYSEDDIANLTWNERSRLLKSDPVTCARFFDYRVHQFINNVLKSSHNPIGKISDYFYRVEFQQRGSPHIHMLVWIENAPKFGENSHEQIVDFIDKYIECSHVSSDDELSEHLKLQLHKHSKTCRKQGKAVCRFGFPLPPMRETVVLEPLDDCTDEQKKEYSDKYESLHSLLDSYKDAASMSCTYDEFLNNIAEMTHDEYIKVIRSSLKGPKVFLKRALSEIRLNNYNRTLMKAWKANLDIQFVLDPYACAMYIVAYVSKSQRGMSNLLDRACREARDGNFDLKRQVRHIGNKFLNSVEISAQEAAYLLLQLPLTKCSREVVFINTSKPDERTFLMKSKEQLEQLPPDSTNIESESLITRYAKRPKLLENWCLADYASKLNFSYPCSKDKMSVNDEENEIEQTNADSDTDSCSDDCPADGIEDSCIKIKLRNGMKITTRKNPRVIRFVSYNKNVHYENYCRERIMLFMPWRSEEKDLLGEFETFANNFQHHKKQIDIKISEYEQKADVLEEAQQMVHEDMNFDEVAPNTEHQEAIDAHTGSKESEQYVFFNPDKEMHRNYDIGQDIGLSVVTEAEHVTPNLLPENEYRILMQSLNVKQRELVTHIMHWIRNETEPFHVFLSGGAGVGKSVVVRALYQTLYKELNTAAGENPEDTRVLLLAPTGKAAYNIKGNTIHSAFGLPASQKLQYKPLSADQLNSLRTKYKNLTVLILDEVSMCGKRMLSVIDQRLQQIKGNNSVFGGVHVLLVGDLFQLRPVLDGWIFHDLDNDYGPLATNLWHDYFTMHELTEIMRQKDDEAFAQLLNRLREGKELPPEKPSKQDTEAYANYEKQFEKQLAEDIKTLETCCIDTQDNSYRHSDPHLYPTNALVDAHNTEVFNNASGAKCIIESLDALVGDLSSVVKEKLKSTTKRNNPAKTAGLSDKLPISCGLRYELCSNLDILDGMTNGASCVLKHFEMIMTETNRPSILWVEFDDKHVGNLRRRKYSRFYHSGIEITWTPIFDITRSFSLHLKTKNASVIRIQFPLRPSAAKTIHKSQGDTLDSVVVNMGTSKRSINHLHYVALSRVRNMSGLQIINLNSRSISVSTDVKQEMRSLRKERSLKLCFQRLYTLQNMFIVAFQNARSFHCHYNDVKTDPNLMAADVLGIAESRLTSYDISGFNLPGYNAIRCDESQCTQQRPHHGLVTFIRQKYNIESYEVFTNGSLEFIVVTLGGLQNIQIVVLYRSPSQSMTQFYSDMTINLVPRVNSHLPLIIIGDFNVDALKCNLTFNTFMNDHFQCVQLIREQTTTHHSALDLIFTNCLEATSGTIACTWSDHYTVFVALNTD